jgi:hypothetical protein
MRHRHIPFPTAGTFGNRVGVVSSGDAIEGAVEGMFAFAGQRHHTLAGPSSDNSVQLDLRGLRIQTSGPEAADLGLVGAIADGEFPPGDRNTLSVVMRGVTGSGPRANLYENVLGPSDPANFWCPPGPAARSSPGPVQVPGDHKVLPQLVDRPVQQA